MFLHLQFGEELVYKVILTLKNRARLKIRRDILEISTKNIGTPLKKLEW